MRIVVVLTSLGMGGAEKQALAVAQSMAAGGHIVTLLVLKPRLAEQWPTTLQTIHLDMSKNPWSALAGIAKARRFLAGFRPDILHSHCFHSNMVARLLHCAGPRPVTVSTIHNVYEGGWPRMLAYRFTDALSRHTVAVSETAARRFIRLKAVSARKCSVIVNGIDMRAFTPDAKRRAAARSAWGLDTAGAPEFLWLAVGRVAPAKDYPNLLHAFARLLAEQPAARLWIAGEPGGSAAECHALTSALRIDGVVRWLGLRRDVQALLDAADGFVSSSAWEGMPLAVAEAMAMEKSVVATAVGGMRELMGDTGSVVQAGDSEALAEAMLGVMRQGREERAMLGRGARKRVVGHFSIEANVVAWAALYRALIA